MIPGHKISAGILAVYFLFSCGSSRDKKQTTDIGQIPDTLSSANAWSRPIRVGDRIEITGGYFTEPIYLKKPPGLKRTGLVVQFIPGHDQEMAAVVKLDERIAGERITGEILVLEFRYAGQTWKDPGPVHIELCDFMPENKAWKERKQGEWIEAAASIKRVN